jgi:bacterioferritin (cytochrome b1)
MKQYRGAKVEVKPAEKLIGRILFLEGTLVFSEIEKMHFGEDIPLMFTMIMSLKSMLSSDTMQALSYVKLPKIMPPKKSWNAF